MGLDSLEAERARVEFEKNVKTSEAVKYAKRQTPRHEVTIAPFFMAKFEVTQAQWRAVAALPRETRDLVPSPSLTPGDNLPVDGVSWDDAVVAALGMPPQDVEVRPRSPEDAATILLDPSDTIRDLQWQARVGLAAGVGRTIEYYQKFGVTQTFTHLAGKVA